MKFKKSKATGLIMDGATTAAGIALGRIMTKKISFLEGNVGFSAGAQVLTAVIVQSTFKGRTGDNLANGLVANALVSLVQVLAKDAASDLGLNGIGIMERPYALDRGSTIMPGVSGMGEMMPNYSFQVQ